MNVPRYAAAAAKFLGRYVPTAAETTTADRARGLATIQAALAARTRRRRRLWTGGALMAVAAAGLLAFGLRSDGKGPAASPEEQVTIRVAPSPGVRLYHGEDSEPLAAQTAIEQGQRLETSATGEAELALSTGTALKLGAATSFAVDGQGKVERFSLRRGRLSAKVAKLGVGQRFIVATPDAEIEVRGTKFSIDVLDRGEACGGGSRSRLAVTEGVVEVRAGGAVELVRAGQLWPADCAATGARPPTRAPAPVTTAAPTVPGAPSAAVRPSRLAQANDSFAEAVALRRQGDVIGALRAYQDVMTRFPTSPLAENALAERMRLLASGPRARTEAQRYLARYPSGFAAEEARQLVAKP